MSTESTSGVPGRWRIYRSVKPRGISYVSGPSTDEIPVVPCDEAAVERAARALHPWMPYSLENARAAAEAVLRAAGETP